MVGTIVTEPAMLLVKVYMFSCKYVGMLGKFILALVHMRFVFTLFMCGIEVPIMLLDVLNLVYMESGKEN